MMGYAVLLLREIWDEVLSWIRFIFRPPDPDTPLMEWAASQCSPCGCFGSTEIRVFFDGACANLAMLLAQIKRKLSSGPELVPEVLEFACPQWMGCIPSDP
jgi:hypothetical protein